MTAAALIAARSLAFQLSRFLMALCCPASGKGTKSSPSSASNSISGRLPKNVCVGLSVALESHFTLLIGQFGRHSHILGNTASLISAHSKSIGSAEKSQRVVRKVEEHLCLFPLSGTFWQFCTLAHFIPFTVKSDH